MSYQISNPNWNKIKKPLYPWVQTIERILCTQELPRLSGPVIYITSDYGGEHKSSKYETISVLYLDLEASVEWEFGRRIVRKQYLADGRRMSFKALGDRKRQKALVPFLDAADKISGINITLAFRKSLSNICGDEKFFELFRDNIGFESKWKYKAFEKMLRVTHLIALLMGGLSKPNQHIYWVSDEDRLFANLSKTQDLHQVLARYSSHYVNHPLGELGLGTTKIDEGDRVEEDQAAVPDLAAGAVAEITTQLSKRMGGRIPTAIAMPHSKKFLPKTEILSSWLADDTQSLKRVVILFENFEKHGVAVSKLDIH